MCIRDSVIGFEKGLLGTEADVAAYEKALDEQAKQEEESQEEEESNTTTTSSTAVSYTHLESLTQKLKFLLVCKVIKLVMLLLFQLK